MSKFAFVIPVYNEAAHIDAMLDQLLPFVMSRPGSLIVVSDNASQDATAANVRARMTAENASVLHLLVATEKGQGVAYNQGMALLEKMSIDPETWVVLSAVDLPFYFSDALAAEKWGEGYDLMMASKAHPRSQIHRGLMREILSRTFRLIRAVLLNMRTRDPQGCLFLRAKYLPLRTHCDARNYFFATQLVYEIERAGLRVLEAPVILRPDDRPSKVRVIRDSLQILRQTWDFSRRRGRIASSRGTEWAPGEALGPDWK